MLNSYKEIYLLDIQNLHGFFQVISISSKMRLLSFLTLFRIRKSYSLSANKIFVNFRNPNGNSNPLSQILWAVYQGIRNPVLATGDQEI